MVPPSDLVSMPEAAVLTRCRRRSSPPGSLSVLPIVWHDQIKQPDPHPAVRLGFVSIARVLRELVLLERSRFLLDLLSLDDDIHLLAKAEGHEFRFGQKKGNNILDK